jgi:outer membrane receptor protein involved in Fe transport
MVRKITTLLLLLLANTVVLSAGVIRGRLTDGEGKGPLVGATVSLIGTRIGAVSDASGNYVVENVPEGIYTLRVAYVGYIPVQQKITVTAEPVILNLALTATTIDQSEVVVERNRAVARETPVAFSDINKMDIEQKIHGQDAPLLVQGTPGVYTYSTDGVGNGEAKVLVRGFSQNYVQVLINGIPTNDPESNAVYWSNWGSVSSNASSIQIQRGAGSSLYGAGSFGGSFNIVTGEAPAKPSYGVNLSAGSPFNSMVGVNLNSGLINNKFAATLRVDRKVAEGTRISGRYEGLNYYMSLGWYINPQQSLKFVLHGAPQLHGYSYSSDIAFFKKYGFTANGAPFLPRNVVDAMPANATTGLANYGLLDDSRELADPNYVNISHNFFHKPQAELHYRYDLNPTSSIQATAFYSKGRGGGSSITNGGTVFARNADNTITTLLGPDGTITSPIVARDTYLRNAQQRISYSFHQQGGILANIAMKPMTFLDLTVGGEYRSWTADHPGHFTNLFGKTSSTISYARQDSTGKVMSSTFVRRIYQGDLDGPQSDVGNIFGWSMAGSKDAAYSTQYRNYRGETPQYTLFAQGNWKYQRLNLMTSIQYVWYKYTLLEYMPSENAIGKMLSRAEQAARGAGIAEGPTGTGTFLMKDSASVNARWYEFPLVDQSRARGFWQPKVGVNYNVNDNLNVFANWAHVERFVNLAIYYNQGRPDPSVGDEKSNQYEVGIGWTSPAIRAKVNGYYMTWENKSASVLDFSKAGQPGYDRNGYHYDLVGTSRHEGIEGEVSITLDNLLPTKGLELTGSVSAMDNKWKDVLDQVKTDPNTGARRAFNTGALDATGKRDTLFFDELAGTPVASGPQMMFSVGLNYRSDRFFCGIALNYAARNIPLDGGSFMAVDGDFGTINSGRKLFTPKFAYKLPSYYVVNLNLGTSFNIAGLSATASVQVLNLLDKEFLADADRNGVYPGIGRSFRFNLSTGM